MKPSDANSAFQRQRGASRPMNAPERADSCTPVVLHACSNSPSCYLGSDRVVDRAAQYSASCAAVAAATQGDSALCNLPNTVYVREMAACEPIVVSEIN